MHTVAVGTAEIVGADAVRRRALELDDLLLRTGAPLPARWPSIDVWMRHNPDAEPWVVGVRDDAGAWTAAALLARRRRRIVSTIVLLGGVSDGWLAASDAASAAALALSISEALSRLEPPWFIRLINLPERDAVARALAGVLPASEFIPGPPAPRIEFERDADLNRYLTRNTRSAVAKARNRISKDGMEARLAWMRDPGEIVAMVPQLIELQRSRDRQVRGFSVLDRPGAGTAFAENVESLAARGHVELLTCTIDSDLAAFALCLTDRDVLRVDTNLVSPTWLRYSAGTIVNAEVVRRAHADPGTSALDWGAGLQRYKTSGSTHVRRSEHLYAWSSQAVRTIWRAKMRLTGGAGAASSPIGTDEDT